ncbi:hypothetical protein NQ318_011562 [Aromia moschata]|uniref:THAP-type domain-containing protein n=1 Tax=Aromia moschata TaxID=1265417 RepID=A0AAV8Z6R4_9CUCU|nr:hypothetical protein NQ318_011562 [Aromia moschata]
MIGSCLKTFPTRQYQKYPIPASKMPSLCCVCPSAKQRQENIHYHRFPSDSVLKKRWVEHLGLTDYKESWRVCSNHFSSESYIESALPGIRSHRLKSTAVPIRSMSDEQNDENCSININSSNNVTPKSENSFMIDGHHIAVTESHNKNIISPNEPLDKAVVSAVKHEKSLPSKTEQSRKGKRSVSETSFFDEFGDGDFLNYRRISDVKWDQIANSPKKARICWEVAVETIQEQRQIIKKYRIENADMWAKIKNLISLTPNLKEKNFLSDKQ